MNTPGSGGRRFDHGGSLGARLVVGIAFFRRQPRHANVNAGLLRIATGIGGADFMELGDGRLQQDHVHVVVVLRLPSGPKLFERPALHWLQVSEADSPSIQHPDCRLAVPYFANPESLSQATKLSFQSAADSPRPSPKSKPCPPLAKRCSSAWAPALRSV